MNVFVHLEAVTLIRLNVFSTYNYCRKFLCTVHSSVCIYVELIVTAAPIKFACIGRRFSAHDKVNVKATVCGGCMRYGTEAVDFVHSTVDDNRRIYAVAALVIHRSGGQRTCNCKGIVFVCLTKGNLNRAGILAAEIAVTSAYCTVRTRAKRNVGCKAGSRNFTV